MAEEKKVPKMLDWVKARAECSIDHLFTVLMATADGDAKAADARSGDNQEFKLKHVAQETFMVERLLISGFVESTVIGFTKSRNSIDVFYQDAKEKKPMFTVTPAVDVDGDCKFQINNDGKPLEAWQVTKRALENFLFERGLSAKPLNNNG